MFIRFVVGGDEVQRQSSCSSVFIQQLAGDAVTWFRDDAGEPIKRMWEITSLWKNHGVPVSLLRSVNPGKTLYQDSYRLVVEEWKKL